MTVYRGIVQSFAARMGLIEEKVISLHQTAATAAPTKRQSTVFGASEQKSFALIMIISKNIMLSASKPFPENDALWKFSRTSNLFYLISLLPGVISHFPKVLLGQAEEMLHPVPVPEQSNNYSICFRSADRRPA